MNQMQKLILACAAAFLITLLIGQLVINLLKRLKIRQHVRIDGPQTHLKKAGVPTMGGVMILIAMALPLPFLLDFSNARIALVALFGTIAYGVIGFLDDFIKIYKARSLGLKAYQKIFGQLLLAGLIAWFAYNNHNIGSSVLIPFTDAEVDLGVWYIPFTIFVIVALVNSVNLIDGLDGLAAGVTSVYNVAFVVLLVLVCGALPQTRAEELKNLAVVAAAATGALFGFLRFNSHPASVFMGDTGSLALGGLITMLAVFSRMTLLIPIMGVMYLLTAISVVLQVGYYKLTKKRIFRMAPLHHHFELGGASETKIVTMYTIVTVFAALAALASVIGMVA